MSAEVPGAPAPVVALVQRSPRVRLSPRQIQQQLLVNLLRKLKDSFEAANLILETILLARSSYNTLYSKRHEFWKNLLVFAREVGKQVGSTPKRFSRRTKKMKGDAAYGIKRGRKIMKSITKLWKSFDSMSNELRTSHQRFEDISQRYWESQDALDNIHRRLETMTPEEMATATMPDFLWIKNNLYPDYIHLKEQWDTLKLPESLKQLKLEFKALQKTDFSKDANYEESSSGSEESDF